MTGFAHGAVSVITALIMSTVVRTADSFAEQQTCQLTRGEGDGWHYRTNIGPRPGRCWYVGPAFKPRSELYWAEAPAKPKAVDFLPWSLELRFKGGETE